MTETIKPLPTDKAIKYLTIYVGESDWLTDITTAYNRLLKKHSETKTKELMRKILACTILLPAYEKGVVAASGSPSNLLFRCSSYHQFNEKDWVDLLQKVMARDSQISKWRNECRAIGIIHPIMYAPLSRQAYNWLHEAALKNGTNFENNLNTKKSFENLVMTYGGKIVCNVFDKYGYNLHQHIPNWRSAYFFERLIFETYTLENVVLLKRQELDKTNPNLVKKIA